MITLRGTYEKMSDQDKDEFWRWVKHATVWRGWDSRHDTAIEATRPLHCEEAVSRVVDLFERNGCSMEEYT
jgi:hypothetical protein